MTPSNDVKHHLVKKFVYICTPYFRLIIIAIFFSFSSRGGDVGVWADNPGPPDRRTSHGHRHRDRVQPERIPGHL